MACRKTVCQECATTWDGINYCVSCLAERREESREPSSFFGWVALAVAIPFLFFVTAHAMVWSGALLAEWLD